MSTHPSQPAHGEGKKPYHHGDLRNCLLAAARGQLDRNTPLTIRGLAKEVGVSPTATYRHFADKRALESALAAQGYEELSTRLERAHTQGGSLPEIACAYVDFALDEPHIFTLMFTTDCDPTSPERVRAVAHLHDTVTAILTATLPQAPTQETTVAMWALTHGLASLHAEAKLPNGDRAAAHARVRETFAALNSLHPTSSAD